jgi:hypothetical protein
LDLSEEEGDDGKPPQKETRLLLAGEASQNAWPPWPWPPWGDDDDGGDGGDDKKRENKTVRAHRLAKEVVEFETKIARASLDLFVFLSLGLNASSHASYRAAQRFMEVRRSHITESHSRISLSPYRRSISRNTLPP